MDESITDLEALYNVEATFEYTGRNGLAQAIRSFVDGRTFPGHVGLDDCTVLVTRFPPALFEEDFDEADNPPIPSKSKNLYFPDSEILILIMKGPIHELVARSVHDILTEKMRKMNCLDELFPTGGKTVQLRGFNKEPDESWGPSINECPTLCSRSGRLGKSQATKPRCRTLDKERALSCDSSDHSENIPL